MVKIKPYKTLDTNFIKLLTLFFKINFIKIKSLFVLLIFVMTFSSCTQDDPQLNEIENVAGLQDHQIEENKLYFSSSESLKELINGKSEEEFI